MEKRKKILVLSDDPLVPSGVGIQTKYLIEGLLKTKKYKFVCLGGALKHSNMQPRMVAPEEFGEGNWLIYPVENHGNKDILRKFLAKERPDAVLMVTDPRFFVWVWEMEDEVRSVCPLLYWHVWDNDPLPDFNLPYYNSTDAIGCISLKTFGILQGLKYQARDYIPHALPENLFKPLPENEVLELKKATLGPHANKDFIVFWNNRNARRKATGDVIATFSKFANKVGKNKVALMMHTMVNDPEGQNIHALGKEFRISDSLILSEERLPADKMNMLYNFVDCSYTISSAEGFGLMTLESLYSGTPIIAQMTGGLQFQVGDWFKDIKNFSNQVSLTKLQKKHWKNKTCDWWGVPIFPAARSCTGSQNIPYIYDDRVSHEDSVDALFTMYKMGKKKRKEIGLKARKWALENYSINNMIFKWDNLFSNTIENFNGVKFRMASI